MIMVAKRKRAADHYAEGVEARESGEGVHPDRLYHVPWIAGYLDIHPDTAYRMINARGIPKVGVGVGRGGVRVLGRSLLRFIEGKAES